MRTLHSRITWSVALSTAVLFPTLKAPPAQDGEEEPPLWDLPVALINEVLFDSVGTDGSAGNAEWLELYTTQYVDLAGFSVQDNQGSVLHVFSSMLVPAYGTVLVLLSDTVPFPHDTDPSDGRVAVAAALPPGDHLGNDSGGVRLVDPGGQIIDSIYWGTGGAPPGSAGQWFDLAFGSGRPVAESESIGRPANPYDTYTGTIADWDRQGGVNAAGATAGGRNGADAQNYSGMLTDAQQTVVGIVMSFSDQVQPGRFSITFSGVGNPVYGYGPTSLDISAMHFFDMLDYGVPTEMSGVMTSSYSYDESPGLVGFIVGSAGTLASPAGFSWDISNTMTVSGFHTDKLTTHSETAVTFHEGTNSYPWTIVADLALERIGQDTWLWTDSRTITDYGGAGTKTSVAQTIIYRLADGVYGNSFSMGRDDPIVPPPLWNAGNQQLQGIETMFIDSILSITSDGEFSGNVYRFDKFLDSSLVLNLSNSEGTPQTGSFSFRVDDSTRTDLFAASTYQLDLPLEAYNYPVAVSATVNGTDTVLGDKYWSSATRLIKYNNTVVANDALYVDPPLGAAPLAQGQCPHCTKTYIHIHICNICDPPRPQNKPDPPKPEPPKAPDPKPKTVGGAAGAAATCAAGGAAVGGTIGGVTGGIIGLGAAGAGAIPGAIAGGKVGGGIGAGLGTAICSVAYFFGWF